MIALGAVPRQRVTVPSVEGRPVPEESTRHRRASRERGSRRRTAVHSEDHLDERLYEQARADEPSLRAKQLAQKVGKKFGWRIHPRTIERRFLRGQKKRR